MRAMMILTAVAGFWLAYGAWREIGAGGGAPLVWATLAACLVLAGSTLALLGGRAGARRLVFWSAAATFALHGVGGYVGWLGIAPALVGEGLPVVVMVMLAGALRRVGPSPG